MYIEIFFKKSSSDEWSGHKELKFLNWGGGGVLKNP